ncbi:MAG: hypothetical protein JWN14_1625 [Chthonomonadales bacterium]|nr:hypothetical protein [Chthonomonadales bacterium]
MPMFQFKRIEQESFGHKVLRGIAYVVEFVWGVCQTLAIYIFSLFSCAMLFLAIVAQDGHLARLSVGFALLAVAMRFGPTLLTKMKRRFRKKIDGDHYL